MTLNLLMNADSVFCPIQESSSVPKQSLPILNTPQPKAPGRRAQSFSAVAQMLGYYTKSPIPERIVQKRNPVMVV